MKPYYEDESVTIYHADCEEALLELEPDFDLLLTDPPYGIGEAAGKNASRSELAVSQDFGNLSWDDKPPSAALINLCRSLCRWQIIFGGNYFGGLPPGPCWLVWDKDNGMNDFADCELAWTNLKKAVRRIRYRWQGMLQQPGTRKERRQHPTQKPVQVMRWCIEQAPPDCATILDPFMGSGTTLRAAKDLGRRAVGVEREERYCEIAAKRMAQGAFDFGGAA